MVGAPGTVAGRDGCSTLRTPRPVPIALVAVTVNVYAVPLVRPGTDQRRLPRPVAVKPPGLDVTVYAVIALPPFDAGAREGHGRLRIARRRGADGRRAGNRRRA